MNILDSIVKGNELQTVKLVNGRQLVIESDHESNVLNIVDADGRLTLCIRITPEGPVLVLDGPALKIQTEGSLSIDAGYVSIHGREGVEVSTNKDMNIKADGDLHSRSRIQYISAELGNVNIKANDDVKIDGERIKLNS